jgi:hypothetical protein
MKIFDNSEPWTSKTNFVDENNVYLGYDMHQSCCENANWFISDTVCEKPMDRNHDEGDLSAWVFDTSYFKQIVSDDEYLFDGGGMVAFRIVNGEKEKFIHLYNVHNGYYGHGFDFKVNDQTIQSDTL